MTAKEFLERGRRTGQIIESLENEYAQVKRLSHLELCAADENTTCAETQALLKKIEDEKNTLIKIRTSIHDVISLVPNRDRQLVLRYRYIEQYGWEDVAVKMNYSLRQVFHIHVSALADAEKIINGESFLSLQ